MTRAFTSEELIAIRRDLHRNPELSHVESRTAAQIAEHLRALGLSPKTGIAGHGVVALIEGTAGAGPTLLYRADIDALPIQETDDREYRSTNEGVMHACGHDVHTTVGLGVAAQLMQRRGELAGNVLMVFQPAEEAAPRKGESIGAELMVEEGILDDYGVHAAFALHVMPFLDAGYIGLPGGPVWAASDHLSIEIHGGMSHGAYPQDGRDPIVAMAQVVNALQSVTSRNVDAREAAVVSICRVHGGTAYNIIPDKVSCEGMIRTLDPNVRRLVHQRVGEIAEGVAKAMGCHAEVTIRQGSYLTANAVALEAFMGRAINESSCGLDAVPFQPQMGAEDFCAFSRRVPSAYLFLGVRNEARGIVHALHTPEFDVDESCIEPGVQAMSDALIAAAAQWDSIAPDLVVPSV